MSDNRDDGPKTPEGSGGGEDERRRRRRRRPSEGAPRPQQAQPGPPGQPAQPRPPQREGRPQREPRAPQTREARPPRAPQKDQKEGRPPQREPRPPQKTQSGPSQADRRHPPRNEPRPPRPTQAEGRRPEPRPPQREPRAPRGDLPAAATIPSSPPPPPAQPEPPAAAPAERWGDDSDAPTPEVHLRADTPIEVEDPDGEQVFLVEDGDAEPPPGVLTNIAGVKFQPAGKIYEFDAGDASYARGDAIIVDTDRGPQLATVAIASGRELIREPLRRIVRRADARDLAAADRFVDKAREALRLAKERVRSRRMAIKMFKVDLLAGGSKAVFYFSSEDRIDFRELVRELTHELRLRIEMRQIGVRDEAKIVGGIGSCGRELCCTTFLPHFDPVSIKMAKDQGLVLNPSKVSGQCGRLKCCLVYEQATYQEMRKGLPKLGKRVTTPAGEGRVAEVDVLRRRVRVVYEPGEFQTFPAEAVAPVITPAGSSLPDARTSVPPEGTPEE